MGVAVVSFFAIFLLITSAGLLIFYRETIQARIASAINPQVKQQRSLKVRLQDTGNILGGMVEHLERVVPRSEAEVSVVQQRLIGAGFRKDSAVKIFYSTKAFCPILLCVLALVSGIGRQNPLFIYIACVGIGFLIPDFVLGKLISNRQAKVRRGLPDVLDMLVICVEAGLSLDQATARTAEELRRAQPVLSDELGMVALEQRAGSVRADAWKHLADRTGVDAVRNLVSMLVQSEQFGTSIAKTLRVHSEMLRTKRVQEIEEKAAKLSIKLLFPLVLFIFPALFVVVIGPAAIIMMQSFKSMFGH
ncbi:MAG: type II secretion system F family protein [Terracidiphilus sp.]